ncbi:Retrovirus-related Pol polyprotein from transposon TNT 1-94 [Eumeta japonica]|uniref:Retrovirus-related Pol polyprotein from transposon TNT 1-94 n=1 Tax=Eumeta variegata TaxID=151549 RepID=A0A4C1XB92_EUMVA|nr:Retrovirus-related Pol polyprotein from transposon TNT 1-94 [Eumeta japonica]
MVCELCQKGKQSRLPFPSEGSRALNPLELIHSDVCGPMETSNSYTPQQNGLAERMNRTLMERARCMLINSDLQKSYWAEAVSTAAYITNRCPTRALSYATPEEMWSGKKPDTYSEAISSPNEKKWKQSIMEELKAHENNETWTLVEKPPGVKTIGCRWVFRIKNDPSGIIYKSRLCAKGCSQHYQIDYTETFSPTTPHQTGEENIVSEVKIPYKEAVGSLMHLAIVSRPDIMFGVSLVSRYLNCYDSTHWAVVKKILKYLKETKEMGILYSKVKNNTVEGYSDSDYAADSDTRRSTTGYVFTKNAAAITWATQRQQSIALSTTEAEFMAACSAAKEALWIKRLLLDISAYNQDSISLNIDNQSAISVIKNMDFHKRCKHIDVKYKFIQEKCQEKEICVKYLCTTEQCADIFTKALARKPNEDRDCNLERDRDRNQGRYPDQSWKQDDRSKQKMEEHIPSPRKRGPEGIGGLGKMGPEACVGVVITTRASTRGVGDRFVTQLP